MIAGVRIMVNGYLEKSSLAVNRGRLQACMTWRQDTPSVKRFRGRRMEKLRAGSDSGIAHWVQAY